MVSQMGTVFAGQVSQQSSTSQWFCSHSWSVCLQAASSPQESAARRGAIGTRSEHRDEER